MTPPAFGQASSGTHDRAPWGRWTAALVLADALLVGANADLLIAYLRDTRIGSLPEPSELIWVQVVGMALGLLVAMPLAALAVWLCRRTSITAAGLGFAAALGILAVLVVTRLNTAIVEVTALDSWRDRLPFDPVVVLLAPALEEPSKAITILTFAWLVRRRVSFGVREGIVAGIAIGLGMTAVEAGLYAQLAYADGAGAIYGTVIAARFGAFGFGLHVATAGLLGAAIGATLTSPDRGRRRTQVLAAAFILALVTHAVWNLVGSTAVSEVVALIAPPPDFSLSEPVSQPLIWIGSTLVNLTFFSPILAILVVAWRRSRPTRPAIVGDLPQPAPT